MRGLGNEKKFAYLNKNFIFIYKILEKGCVCVWGGFFYFDARVEEIDA